MKTKLLVFATLLTTAALFAQDRRYPPPNDPWNYRNGPGTWDRSWNDRPFPQRGACFFTDAGFRGNRFCIRAGERLPALPGNFGDNISSVQLFGGGAVQVFNDREFSGGSARFRDSIPDLRNRRFRGGHTWNNRISSVAVF